MTFVESMQARFGDKFKEQEILAKHLNFRIGGAASYFVEAVSSKNIVDAVTLAKQFNIPWFVLGGGSNTLVADSGFKGLVIKAANRQMKIDDNRILAESGVIAATIARASAQAGLRGFEWAISLPGTIGGAVRGNAGCFGGEIKDNLESARVLHNGIIKTLLPTEIKFAYRDSIFKHSGNDDVVLDVTLLLKQGDSAEAMSVLEKNLANRKASQPLGSSSAGCIFKNYEFNTETDIAQLTAKYQVPEDMLDRRRLAAGWLIDQLGLKGTRIGDAMVSETHGNFLVNKGAATGSQIMELISLIKARVNEEVGIELHEEVQCYL